MHQKRNPDIKVAKNQIQIIFENDDFIAIDKPAGMLSIPDREQSEKSLKSVALASLDDVTFNKISHKFK